MIRRASLLIVLCGCGASAPLPRAPEAQPAPVVAADEAAPAPSMVDAMREQMLCLGRCPPPDLDGQPPSNVELTLQSWTRAYAVKVRTDGTVVFEGYPGGKLQGRVVEHIDPADAQALVRRFESAGARFDASDVSAPEIFRHVTDLPASSLTLTRGRRTLTILQLAGAPFALADEVDRVTRADRWVSCTEGLLPSCSER